MIFDFSVRACPDILCYQPKVDKTLIGDFSYVAIDRLGNPTVHIYDNRGNVLSSIDAQGNVPEGTYDGNELTITDALGNTMIMTYDGTGNQTSVTDALGHVTSFTHHASRN